MAEIISLVSERGGSGEFLAARPSDIAKDVACEAIAVPRRLTFGCNAIPRTAQRRFFCLALMSDDRLQDLPKTTNEPAVLAGGAIFFGDVTKKAATGRAHLVRGLNPSDREPQGVLAAGPTSRDRGSGDNMRGLP